MSQLAHCACASTAVLRSRGHNLCAKKGIGCTNAHHARKRIAGCSTIIAKANMLIWTPRQKELSAEKAADKQEAVMCGMKADRKSVVWGKSVSVRVDRVGRRSIKKKKRHKNEKNNKKKQ